MLRGNIAANSLKIIWKNLYSDKYYDKSNMNVFTLSLWENFRWGLIYFDQFSQNVVNLEIQILRYRKTCVKQPPKNRQNKLEA